MANAMNPNDGYADLTDEQLAALPGAPKRGANGGYVYSWRPEAYADVLGDNDVKQQQDIQNFRKTYGEALTADDDKGALAQMSGKATFADGSAVPGTGNATSQWNNILGNDAPQATAPTSATNPRRDAFFNTLMGRANQTLTTDWQNDPNVKAQVGAYMAAQERARRNSVSDAAEAAGPLANIGAERVIAGELAGRNTANFQASIIGSEIAARRAEIQNALTGAQGMLTADQQAELQTELANLNAKLQQTGFNLQDKSLGLDWQKALLGNDLSQRQLGLNEWDRANYWDAIRSGFIGA